LEELTRDRVPLDWATTENNLGNVLGELGVRESGTDDLRAAVTAYQSALQERTRDRVPLDWAATENNLGYALDDLGVREQNATYLQDAVTDWNSSLSVFRNEPMPPWATTIPYRITKAQADISAIKKGQ
jgi:hypothetical protein